ncbi:phospholipase D family protein [Colwellia asteriadis]|uniref:Phospholipase D family protein n=1 Tax=Colwellia asteriadis TaxID=517723 RepID=A0ABP3WF59_9GAMM
MSKTIAKQVKITVLLCLFIATTCLAQELRIPVSQFDHCGKLVKQPPANLAQHLMPFSKKMLTHTGVYVLEEDTESLLTRAWLSENAEQTIDVQYFIFSTDNIGLIAIDYLMKAAERGVKVRVLVDDIMVEANGDELLKLAAHPNFEIKIYNPTANIGKNIVDKLISITTNFHGLNQRMHNKTFTVDGKVAITGGRNLADEYFGYDHQYNFRDRDVMLIGGVSTEIQRSFDQFWHHELSVPINKLVSSKQKFSTDYSALHQYACNPDNFVPEVRAAIADLPNVYKQVQQAGDLHWLAGVEYISDVPGKNAGDDFLGGSGLSTQRLIRLLKQAKTSVTIQTPYLITTSVGKNLLKALVARGVEVKILTNSLASNDNLEAFSGYQRDRDDLLDTGIALYEFKPDAQIRKKIMADVMQGKLATMPIFGLHAKTLVIDDNISVIGTFNFDPRSANLNTESITIIPSIEIAKKVKQGMLEEMAPENAWRITKDFNPDHTVSRTKRLRVKLRRIVPKNIL